MKILYFCILKLIFWALYPWGKLFLWIFAEIEMIKMEIRKKKEQRKQIMEDIKYQNLYICEKRNLQIVLIALIIHSYLIKRTITQFFNNLGEKALFEQQEQKPINYSDYFVFVKNVTQEKTNNTKTEDSETSSIATLKKRIVLISEALEGVMESYYHKLFDDLPKEQLEVKKLKELVNIATGFDPPRSIPQYRIKAGMGNSWINSQDLKRLLDNQEKFIFSGSQDITSKSLKSWKKGWIPKNSILFSKFEKNDIGKMGISENKLFFSSSIFGISTTYDGDIYYYWFLLKTKVKTINKLCKTKKLYGNELKHISLKDLQNFEIDLPPKELISKFNQFCEPFFAIQRNLQRELRELSNLKNPQIKKIAQKVEDIKSKIQIQ